MNSILWNYPQVAWRSTTQNQWWGMQLVTPPSGEPLTLDQVKAHLRVDRTDEDTLISSYLTAARQYCEDVCGRAFMTQTWDLWLQQWPAGDRIFLPKPPIQSVTYVQYTDLTETTTAVDPSTYVVNTAGDLAEVVLRFGLIWPPTPLSPSRPVNVRLVTGYGNASAVPVPITQAILLLVGHWYANRESVVTDARVQSVRVDDTVDALLARYRMPSYSPDPMRP
jgi:uncharacterized phiE125 gp8 family phage protein